jgi:GAF domain-containing protein
MPAGHRLRASTLGPDRARRLLGRWPGVVVLLLVSALGGCHPRPRNAPQPAVAYAGAWEYRYGDSPQAADGSGYVWAQSEDQAEPPPAGVSGGWQPTTILEDPPGRNGARFLWMRTLLVGPPMRDPVLLLVDIDQSYEAYLDGKLIDRFGPLQGRKYPGLPKVYLPLGPDYAGKTLALRIYSPYEFIGLFGTPTLAGSSEAVFELVDIGLTTACMGMLTFLLGVISLVLFGLLPRETMYLYYAGVTLGFGLHLICRSVMREMIADLGPAWTYLELGSNALGGAALCAFVAQMFGPGPLRIVRRVGGVMLFATLVCAVLVAAGVVHIWSLLRPLQYYMMVVVACVLFTAVRAVRRRDSDGKVLAAGVGLCSVLVFFELLMVTGILPRWRLTLGHYTIFLFSLSMATLLALRFVRVHRRLQNYSMVLQLSLSQARVLEQGQHMQVALGEVLRLIGGDRALLFECSADRKEPTLTAGMTAGGEVLQGDVEWDSTLVNQVQRRRQPSFLWRERDRAGVSVAERAPRRERISCAAAPLLSRGELLGIIYLEADGSRHRYDKEDLEILLGLGNQVALTLMSTRAVRLELEGALARRRLAEQDALLQAAGRMAGGDLDSVISGQSSGELAPLANALDTMRQDLRLKFQTIEKSNVEIKQLNEELRRQIEARSQRLMDLILSGKRPDSGAEVAPGRALGEHYRVVRTLGQGAMGSVFEVERTTDHRRLAAKVLSEQSDRTALLRFAREAQILARLDHPNLVAISDIDITPSGVLFLVMELVRGTTLKLSRERYRDLSFATQVTLQMAEGLAAIHESGIIHRGPYASKASSKNTICAWRWKRSESADRFTHSLSGRGNSVRCGRGLNVSSASSHWNHRSVSSFLSGFLIEPKNAFFSAQFIFVADIYN